MRLSITTSSVSPDIIHLIGTNALAFSPLSKLLRAGGRIVRHIFTSYDRSDQAVRPVRWLANTLFIDSYAFTTPRIGQWAQERSPRTRRFLIRPPINCELYRPLDSQTSGSLPGRREKTILYIGPLWGSRFPAIRVLKGIKHLANKGVDAHLLILTSAIRTSAMDSEMLLTIARSLGLDSRLTIRRVDLSEQERVTAYNAADVVIFPYVGPVPERLADPPFGILEAMACGRMVLATDVLSISEIVRNEETGFVIDDCTSEEIAAGLYRALTTPYERAIGRNARERILADFSYSKVRESLMSSYSSLLT